MTTVEDEKTKLRQALSRARDDLDPKVRAAAAERMLEHLRGWSVFEGARGVAAFVSIRSEPDTRALCEVVLRSGRPLWLPRVHEKTRLVFHRCEGSGALDGLVSGGFGLREPPVSWPAASALSRREGIDLVVVPGLGFGRDGARLGYGAGYYDRALSAADEADRPTTVGFAFWRQIDPPEGSPPMVAHDVRMHHLLTERGVQSVLA